MNKQKQSNKQTPTGRPIVYSLTARQENAIRSRLDNGLGAKAIRNELGYELSAILRVRKNWLS